MIAAIHDQEAVAWLIVSLGFITLTIVIVAYCIWGGEDDPAEPRPGIDTLSRGEGADLARTGASGYGVALRALGDDADALELDFRRPGSDTIRHWTGSGWRV